MIRYVVLVDEKTGAVIGVEGPDLVDGRAQWDHVFAEVQREISRRCAKIVERNVLTPDEAGFLVGGARRVEG